MFHVSRFTFHVEDEKHAASAFNVSRFTLKTKGIGADAQK